MLAAAPKKKAETKRRFAKSPVRPKTERGFCSPRQSPSFIRLFKGPAMAWKFHSALW